MCGREAGKRNRKPLLAPRSARESERRKVYLLWSLFVFRVGVFVSLFLSLYIHTYILLFIVILA